MIRVFLFLAFCAIVVALAGPERDEIWAWWGFAAALLGAALSVGPWALGLIAKIRAVEHYQRLQPQFTRAAETLSIAGAFIPMLRAINAVLAAVAFGALLIRKRRLLQALIIAFALLVAIGGPLIQRAVEHSL